MFFKYPTCIKPFTVGGNTKTLFHETMINAFINLVIVILTILFNCLLTYELIWDPYSLYFDRPEFSKINFNSRDNYAASVAGINFLLLLTLTVLMIRKIKKTDQLLIVSPLFSGLTLFLLLHIQSYYPDSETEYTKHGYRYLEQRWYLHNKNVFKRFKSGKPLNAYSDHKTIVWQLDSSSKVQ